MGKLKDMFNTQIKEFGKYEKKKRWIKTIPKFINFNITIRQLKEIGITQFDIIVTNLLDVKDKRKIFTKASKVDDKGLILNIMCPFCGTELKLNKHWNAYFCTKEDRKILEIIDIKYERPKQVKELDEDTLYSLKL